jgi:GAF domain-containing protein
LKPFTLPILSDTDELVADAAASPWSMPLLAAQHSLVAGGADLDALFEATAASALAILPSATGALVAMRSSGGLACVAASGSADFLVGTILSPDTLSARCLADARLVHCEDARHDGRVDKAFCRRPGIYAMILVPLPCRGEMIGLLAIHADRPNPFDGRDRLAAQMLAGPIALGLAATPPPAPRPDPRLAAAHQAAAGGRGQEAPRGGVLLV